MNETEYVTNVYDKIASHFDVTRVTYWNWVTDFVTSLPKGSSILDIGCGNGRNMTYPDYNFTGIDSSKEFIKMCEKRNLRVILGDMTQLPFEDNSFDAVLSIASFHHLTTKKRRNLAMSEIYRVLKPGGKCVMSVWSKEQPVKTRRVFDTYGDTIVKWKNSNQTYSRYYYIFEIDELI